MTSEVEVSVHLPQVELQPVGAPAGPGQKWTQHQYFWLLLGPQNLMITVVYDYSHEKAKHMIPTILNNHQSVSMPLTKYHQKHCPPAP